MTEVRDSGRRPEGLTDTEVRDSGRRPEGLTENVARRVFIVRHGRTEWNKNGRAQGQTQLSKLDEVGLAQVEKTGARIAALIGAHRPVQLWSSDLERCRQTAAPIIRATSLECSFHEDMRERSFGKWEGEMLADCRLRLTEMAERAGISREDVRPPGGESTRDVWDRAGRLAERVHDAEIGGTLVLVSHGMLLSILIARLLDKDFTAARDHLPRNASITELERLPNRAFRLIRFDDVDHLGEHAVSL